MEEIVKLEIENLKKRSDKTEQAIAELKEKLAEQDKLAETINIQLKYMSEKIEEVATKQDQLLKIPSELTNDKAQKWDKIIYTIVGTAVGLLVTGLFNLIIK